MKMSERFLQNIGFGSLSEHSTSAHCSIDRISKVHEPLIGSQKTKNMNYQKKRSLIFIDCPDTHHIQRRNSETFWLRRIRSCNWDT